MEDKRDTRVALTLKVQPYAIQHLLAVVDVLEEEDWYDQLEHVEAIVFLIDSFIDMRLSPEAKADSLTALESMRKILKRELTPWE